MRANEILFEYKRDVTAKKMGMSLMRAAAYDSSIARGAPKDMIDNVLIALEEMDPSPTKKYVQWLAVQYTDRRFRSEDAGRVRDVIARFIRFLPQFKRLGKNSDLNTYTFHQLEKLMDELSGTDLSDGGESSERDDIRVLYNGPLGTLSVPLTMEASCLLGRGTKWCTAANEHNQFESYNRNGPLFVWRDRDGSKFQFHFDEHGRQLMDAQDEPILPEKIREFRKHPVLSKLFKKEEEKIMNGHDAAARCYWYARDVIGERWLEAEPIIAKDELSAFAYARNVIKGPWPEAGINDAMPELKVFDIDKLKDADLNELLDIYAEFLDIKGYPPHLSANELYEDPSFREEDREWLDAFLDAWEEQDQ